MKLKGKEILIVDDDEQFQFFLKNILTNLGISITQVVNYEEALKSLEESIPHLIITDIKLNSSKNGLDLQKYIKGSPHFKDIPLFVISADSSKQTIYQSLALGANEYILKPIIAKDIIQKIRRCFLDYKSPSINFFDDEKGTYKESYLKAFGDSFEIEIESHMNLRAINELSCILQGPIKFPKESVIKVDSDFLNSIGADGLGFRSMENSRIIEAGIFSTRFSLIGIDEKTAQKIRSMRVTKKT